MTRVHAPRRESIASDSTAPTAPLLSARGHRQALRGAGGVFGLTVALNILSLAASTLGAVAGAWAVSAAVLGAETALLLAPVILVAAAIVTRAISAWLESWLSHDLSFRLLARVRLWIYDAIGRLAPAGLRARRTGELTASALSDAEALEIFYAHSSLYRVTALVLTPLLLGALAFLSPSVAVAVLPLLLVAVLVVVFSRRGAHRHGAVVRRTLAELGAEMAEDLGAVREILGYGLVAEREVRHEALLRRLDRAQRGVATRAGAETAVLGLLALGASAIAAAVAAGEVAAGGSGIAFTLTLVLAGAVPVPILQWAAMSRHSGLTGEAASRIEELLRAVPPVQGYGTAVVAEDARGLAVDAEGLGVDWASSSPGEDGRRWALSEVSFSAPAGSTLSVAGRSGAGKSTLAAVLARHVEATAGEVTLDEIRISDFSTEALTQAIMLLPQDVALFAESVRDNLQLARDETISDGELWAALEAAQIAELVHQMRDGLDTVLHAGGGSLSGGERQRLALARAGLHGARVLVLDEAVSQLDVISETSVHRALVDERRGRTTITIAHRLSTLLTSERILMMVDGRVVGDGTHADLLRDCAPYRELVRPQIEALA